MCKAKVKFIFLAILFFGIFGWAESSLAANYYISNAPKGSHDCSSWVNACTPSDITYGGAHHNLFADGNNFYFDGGASGMTYASPYITNGTNGTDWTRGVTFATGAKSPSPSGHDGYVTFDGQGILETFLFFRNVSHVIIDGEKNGAINWELRNTKLDSGSPGRYIYAVIVEDSGSFGTKYSTIRYIWVDKVSSGIKVLFNTNVDIGYNRITNVYHETAIDARGFSDVALGTNKIHHNEIENTYDPVAWSSVGRHGSCGNATGYGPDGIQASENVDIYNNTFTTRTGETWYCQHPDAIQADWSKMRIYNNKFLGGPSLFQNSHERNSSSNVSDLWFYNNLMINYTNGMQSMLGGDGTTSRTRIYVFNNTFDGVKGGFAIPSSMHTLGDVQVRNNIFLDGWNVGWLPQSECGYITYSNNATGGRSMTCGAPPADSYQINVTNTNGQMGTPTFVSRGSDYRLVASDTVAKDHGYDLSAYFITDQDGTSRPQGVAWDIGAYEYVSGSGDTTPPLAPTGLSVV